MPVGDITGWRQVLAQDFNQNAPLGQFRAVYGDQWGGYNGSRDTSRNGLYSPDRVLSAHDGVMDMWLHTENGQPLVAAPIPPVPGYSQTYGRYSVRFRADAVPGYKTAWLLWPSGSWDQGEIDFPEGSLDGTIGGYSHSVGNPTQNCAWVETPTRYTDWHVATIEWQPGRVSFFLDGQQIMTTTNSNAVPTNPMFWVLQTETQLSGGVPPASAQGHVLVDWAVAYTRM